jgi:hypothetical protein
MVKETEVQAMDAHNHIACHKVVFTLHTNTMFVEKVHFHLETWRFAHHFSNAYHTTPHSYL